MSGLVGLLLDGILKYSENAAKAQEHKDNIAAAAARLGFQGANPTDQDIESKLHGGGPDYRQWTPEQAQAEVVRQKALADASDRNAADVANYKLGAAQDAAGYSGKDFAANQLATKLPDILSKLSVRQQADVINQKPLGDPYILQAGAMGNTETGKISDTTAAVNALANLRNAQAGTEVNKQGAFDAQANVRNAQAGTEVNKQGALDAQAAANLALQKLRDAQTGEQFDKTNAANDFFNSRDPRSFERSTGKAFPGENTVVKGSVDGKPVMGRTLLDKAGNLIFQALKDSEGKSVEAPSAVGRGPGGDQVKSEYYQKELDISPVEALDLINSDPLGDSKAEKIKVFAARQKAKNSQADTVYQQAKDALNGGPGRPPKDPKAIKAMLLKMGLDPSKVGL